MLNKIFNAENPFFKFCGKLADAIVLSFLWFICCLPIITISASCASLYRCVVEQNNTIENSYANFFKYLKQNLIDGISISLLSIVIFFAISYQLLFLWTGAIQGYKVSYIFFVFTCVFSILPIGFICWINPIFSRYQLSFTQLVLVSFKFIFAHLFSTIFLVLIAIIVIFVAYMFIFPIPIAPYCILLLQSFFVEKAFKKHT